MPTVLGYHGCEKMFADGVRVGQVSLAQWKPSQNRYDWLGEGIYFWEASRTRAEQWAIEHFGDQGSVLAAEIELGVCLDLLENTYHDDLRLAYRNLQRKLRSQGLTMPTNDKKRHDLDNLVINYFVTIMANSGIYFQTVRSAFEEGRPVFPGSAIRTHSHVQIAVRDVQCLGLHKETEKIDGN